MRYSLCTAAFAALAAAAPLEKRQDAKGGPTDPQIINYALTLEHLEDTFYKEVLEKFSAKDFEEAGLPATFYNNLEAISSDEAAHVDFLTSALTAAGAGAVAACTYEFGLTTVDSFLALAATLEGVGVSAYLGAAQYIATAAYLEAAGSILTVEARHSAYLREHQQPQAQAPFPAPFDIPLDFDEVYSLAAQFITACPSGNAADLPALKAFPAITATPASAQAGDKLSLAVASSVEATAAYFITALGPVAAKIYGSGKAYTVTVPPGVQAGQEYLVLTNSNSTPTDSNIVAGPAIIQIADYITLLGKTYGSENGWYGPHGHWYSGSSKH